MTTVTEPISMKLILAAQRFVNNFYTELHENRTKGLVADSMLEIDRWADGLTWDPNKAFFYFLKKT